jgi:hypothetical protein
MKFEITLDGMLFNENKILMKLSLKMTLGYLMRRPWI